MLAGDPANERAEAKGNVKGDAFGCPDGLWIDGRGVLWIQTDMSTSAMGKGDLARLGNNAMLAADPRTGEIRRFLVGPGRLRGHRRHRARPTGARCSSTSSTRAKARASAATRGAAPLLELARLEPDGRPRSATVVIRRRDGGVVGT